MAWASIRSCNDQCGKESKKVIVCITGSYHVQQAFLLTSTMLNKKFLFKRERHSVQAQQPNKK